MPRIAPRLLRVLSQKSALDKHDPFDISKLRYRPKSLRKPFPPLPSFRPACYSNSILLAPNPITRSRDYARRKSLPPRVYIPKCAQASNNEYDRPRQMNDDERRWWGNPYLRMLSSPMRLCTVTNRYFPSDFLIRLGRVKVHSENSSKIIVVPDGLQHSKFTSRRGGKAAYIACSRDAFQYIRERGQVLVGGQAVHPNLTDYVAHLLRLRVLQELELLAEQLEYTYRTFKTCDDMQPILRRLTRHEWKQLKETGIIPFTDAIAVLVVPPLNKDPLTKQIPKTSMSDSPLPDGMRARKILPPLSSLHSSQSPSDVPASIELPDAMTTYEIPFYNGLALFPNQSQRSALHSVLLRILATERNLYQSTKGAKGSNNERQCRVHDNAKHSHAFLLSSNSGIVRRGDASAIAIALWRIRMFEGEEVEDGNAWTSLIN